MLSGEKTGISLILIAGMVAGFAVLQRLVARIVFDASLEWSALPQLIMVNFGIAALWLFIREPNKRVPAFITMLAACFFAVGIRAALFYLGVFRAVAPLVMAFVEKQIGFIVSLISLPQSIPVVIAAGILLMLLPRVKTVYRRLISN